MFGFDVHFDSFFGAYQTVVGGFGNRLVWEWRRAVLFIHRYIVDHKYGKTTFDSHDSCFLDGLL